MSWIDRIFGTGQRGQEPPQEQLTQETTPEPGAEKITEQGARV